MIYEPHNRLDVTTPKGDGIIWLVTEYGHETDTMYTVIINATGELWQYTHRDIIAVSYTHLTLPTNREV